MKKSISDELNDFFNDDLMLNVPKFASLNDDDNFEDYGDYEIDDDVVTIDDDEFNKILDSLGSSSKKEEKKEFTSNLELEYAKLRLEREALEQEKAVFERQKKEWETLKKLSEESFKAEKEEFVKKIKIEKEKLYLETKGIINSCTDINNK